MTNQEKLAEINEFIKSKMDKENDLRREMLNLTDKEKEKKESERLLIVSQIRKLNEFYDLLDHQIKSGIIRPVENYNA